MVCRCGSVSAVRWNLMNAMCTVLVNAMVPNEHYVNRPNGRYVNKQT